MADSSDDPRLGIEITGDSNSAQEAAKSAEATLLAVTQAALDSALATTALARAQEDAAQAFYDVVKAQQAEAEALSSVDVALTRNTQLQATAYNSVTVALEQKRVAMQNVAAAEQAFNAQMENGLAILNAQRQAIDESNVAADRLGATGQSAFGKLVMGSREAHGAMLGLNTAMQGGVGTVVGLSRVLNDLFLLVRTAGAAAGPWALLALAIGAVLGVLRGLTQHFGEHKTAVDSAAKSHKNFQDEAKKDLKAIDDEVKELSSSYAALETRINAAATATKEMAKAQNQLAEDTIKADEKVRLSKASSASEEKKITQDATDQLGKLKTANEENDLINQRLSAGLQKTTADRQSTAIEADRRALQEKLDQKQQAFDLARGSISDSDVRDAISNATNTTLTEQLNQLDQNAGLSKSTDTAAGSRLSTVDQAQKDALDARKERDAAKKALDDFNANVSVEETDIEKKIKAAQDSIDRANVGGQDLTQRQRADQAQKDIENNKSARDVIAREDTLKAGEVAKEASYRESITEAQTKLYSLQGASFNAQQLVLNSIIDKYQQEILAYERTLKQLETQRMKFENARSYSQPTS